MFLALAFVTLPFIVRTVQPVLEELEHDVEEAAASLGAGRLTIFRRIILPSLVPGDRRRCGAVVRPGDLGVRLAGAAVGQPALPDRGRLGAGAHFIEGGNAAAAASVASVMLAIALLVIVVLDLVQRRVARRG